MQKIPSRADQLLSQLGALSSLLTQTKKIEKDSFSGPLTIIRQAMGFDVGVLYKILNIVDNYLILEVVLLHDPQRIRNDLFESKRLRIDLNAPPKIYFNEAASFAHKSISCVNIPGLGCDMVGLIYLPDDFGGGYLFGGDFYGKESAVPEHEVRACEIMCNLMSAILMKTRFEHLAIYDELTGLLNSRIIRDTLRKVILRHQRNPQTSFAVVLGDIDFFKRINDTYGHIQGDKVLEEVGALMKTAMRETLDAAGRYGGEEFLLIYEGINAQSAFDAVERLRQTLMNHPFTRISENGLKMEGETLSVTMSFGMAMLTESQKAEEPAELLAKADAALYQSKLKGRNQVSMASE